MNRFIALIRLARKHYVDTIFILPDNTIYMETEKETRKVKASEYDEEMVSYLLDLVGLRRENMQIGNAEIEVDGRVSYIKVSIMNDEITVTLRENLV